MNSKILELLADGFRNPTSFGAPENLEMSLCALLASHEIISFGPAMNSHWRQIWREARSICHPQNPELFLSDAAPLSVLRARRSSIPRSELKRSYRQVCQSMKRVMERTYFNCISSQASVPDSYLRMGQAIKDFGDAVIKNPRGYGRPHGLESFLSVLMETMEYFVSGGILRGVAAEQMKHERRILRTEIPQGKRWLADVIPKQLWLQRQLAVSMDEQARAFMQVTEGMRLAADTILSGRQSITDTLPAGRR